MKNVRSRLNLFQPVLR
uniref:Uncharacterized protein n=1 Tax=Anguilla anguilla TaxID=7936 RepID=A0A0E9RHV7_ANGAN